MRRLQNRFKRSESVPREEGRDKPSVSRVNDFYDITAAKSAAEKGKKNKGDDSVRVPPLPIPNREVKPHHADGTAKVGE